MDFQTSEGNRSRRNEIMQRKDLNLQVRSMLYLRGMEGELLFLKEKYRGCLYWLPSENASLPGCHAGPLFSAAQLLS